MENKKLTVIQNARIIRNGKITENQALAFENGLIVDLPDNWEKAEIIDARGQYLSAGFIDLHTHGGGGHDFLDGTVEAFLGAANLHAQYGTTTLLPTATSGTYEETCAMFDILKKAQAQNTKGADMPGFHLEGP